jgi:hypothetical protein
MSTRGAITRFTDPEDDLFSGVYHHEDSDPAKLGKTLFRLCRSYPLEWMLSILINKHGWLNITRDRSMLSHIESAEEILRAQHVPVVAERINQDNAAALVDYVYAFDVAEREMYILTPWKPGPNVTDDLVIILDDDREPGWEVRAIVYLDGPEPRWEDL